MKFHHVTVVSCEDSSFVFLLVALSKLRGRIILLLHIIVLSKHLYTYTVSLKLLHICSFADLHQGIFLLTTSLNCCEQYHLPRHRVNAALWTFVSWSRAPMSPVGISSWTAFDKASAGSLLPLQHTERAGNWDDKAMDMVVGCRKGNLDRIYLSRADYSCKVTYEYINCLSYFPDDFGWTFRNMPGSG